MTEPTTRFSINLGNMIGWVFGALSVVNLINDFNWIELRGKLAKWIEAYGEFVHKLNKILFGWIDFYWFEISATETHFLIVIFIVGTSTIKSARELEYVDGLDAFFMLILLLALFFVCPAIILLLIVEPPSRIVVLLFSFFLIGIITSIKKEEKKFYFIFANNTLPIFTILLVVIAVNYGFF